MTVPVCPLGDLDGYKLHTLEELADQHLERAAELRRKLERVIERYELIVKAIDRKNGHPPDRGLRSGWAP